MRRFGRRRGPRTADADEWVVVSSGPLFEAPLVVERLAAAGVSASYSPAFDVVTRTQTNADVVVRRRDEAAALEVLAGFGELSP